MLTWVRIFLSHHSSPVNFMFPNLFNSQNASVSLLNLSRGENKIIYKVYCYTYKGTWPMPINNRT